MGDGTDGADGLLDFAEGLERMAAALRRALVAPGQVQRAAFDPLTWERMAVMLSSLGSPSSHALEPLLWISELGETTGAIEVCWPRMESLGKIEVPP